MTRLILAVIAALIPLVSIADARAADPGFQPAMCSMTVRLDAPPRDELGIKAQ